MLQLRLRMKARLPIDRSIGSPVKAVIVRRTTFDAVPT